MVRSFFGYWHLTKFKKKKFMTLHVQLAKALDAMLSVAQKLSKIDISHRYIRV